MLRLKDNPPLTWPDPAALPINESATQHWAGLNWTVAYCKPRQEKSLAWDLCRNEVPYFLPMVMRETYSGGRRRRNLHPMFKSYLFFAGGEDERLAVLKTNRLVQLVPICPAEQPSFRRQINSLELALRVAPDKLELYSHIVEGSRVQIIGGPLKGVEGVILKAENKTRLWIGVNLMGAGATVEIHADLIEPVGEVPAPTTTQIEYHVGGGKFIATTRF